MATCRHAALWIEALRAPRMEGPQTLARRRQRARMQAWIAGATAVLGMPWALSGCATLVSSPAVETWQVENICSIFEERLDWYRVSRDAELRWGVPIPLQVSVIYQESSFRPRARPPRGRFLSVFPGPRLSSAYGYGQVIDSTWEEYRESTGGASASRDDFADVADFIGWYSDQAERRLGILKSDGFRFYLAYHEGFTGYRRASYRGKPLIEQAARRVELRARRYDAQLESCRVDLEERLTRPWWWPL
jgi:hypothetical protein